jgi:hypothetical protein
MKTEFRNGSAQDSIVVPNKRAHRALIRDPYAAAVVVSANWPIAFFQQPKPVVMGSCFRRNDVHTGSAAEYFTWLNAKLDSIEAMPSSRVSLFFKNAS